MRTDWLAESLTEEQRERYRSCWVLLSEQNPKQHTFTLRPYLYEQFFAPDAQRHAVPMILDVLTLMTDHLPILTHFYCVSPEHPDAPMLADCCEAFGTVIRSTDSPSFLLYTPTLPVELMNALLFDPDSAFHVQCNIPRQYLVDKISALPYHGCLWYLNHGMRRMRLDYLSGRPMLEILTDPSVTADFLMARIAPMVWRHRRRLVVRK